MKVVLFTKNRYSQYDVLNYFLEGLHEAFIDSGIDSRIINYSETSLEDIEREFIKDPPDCTFSFNLINWKKIFPVPHVLWCVDSVHYIIPIIMIPYSIVGTVDRSCVDFLRKLGFPHALFLPHAVKKTITPGDPKKEYDAVFLGSFIDYKEDRASWIKKYPPDLFKIMNDTVDIIEKDSEIPYYEAFLKAADRYAVEHPGIDLRKLNFNFGVTGVELYFRGKEKIELLKSIKKARVDVFSRNSNILLKYIPDQPNIFIHEPVLFPEALEIMKRSKIVLHSCSWIKNGGHERIFSGLACGALVMTPENPYLKEQFKNDESIVFIPQNLEKMDEIIQEYLVNEAKRSEIAGKGREIVMKYHTWNQRVAQILQELPPFVSQIKARIALNETH